MTETPVHHLEHIADLRDAVGAARDGGARIGLVPTMGALHEGHLSLVRVAAAHADTVVVSIFVNPTQFDRADDLASYPRDLAGDLTALRGLGPAAPALVFAPPPEEIYPREFATSVRVSGLSAPLEGAARPGHFDAVATVVAKLLNIARPDLAVFGRKDYQQLLVIRRMVADLDLPVQIVAAPTVREPGGLALSSRNRLLSAEEREAALSLPRALRAAVELARTGRTAGRPATAAGLRGAVTATLADAPVVVDYVAAVDAETLTPLDGPVTARVLVALAATVGRVRLIDNVEVGDSDDEQRLLEATGGVG